MEGCKADQTVSTSSNTEVQNRNNFTTTILKRLQGAQKNFLSQLDVISTGSLLASDRVVKLNAHHLVLG